MKFYLRPKQALTLSELDKGTRERKRCRAEQPERCLPPPKETTQQEQQKSVSPQSSQFSSRRQPRPRGEREPQLSPSLSFLFRC